MLLTGTRRLIRLALVGMLGAYAGLTSAPGDAQTRQNILVDPAGGSRAGFRTVPRIVDVPFTGLGPGSLVIVRGGVYADAVFVTSRGTADAPVTVMAEQGATPVLTNSLAFDNAAYVSVSGLTILGAPLAGIIIRYGSTHVTVANSTVAQSMLGILISDQAGAGHRLVANQLDSNKTFGIAVNVINAPSTDPTWILNNTVTNSAIHGMEINGSGYIIEGNRVVNNGITTSGSSGIHIYAKDANQDAGDRNVIRYNIVIGQKETTGQDGNGIQIDQWCDNNFVAFNVAAVNDGAGIIVYDGANNYIVNNTAFSNSIDSGAQHAYRGEIIVANDINRSVDRTANNRIVNNLVVSTRAAVPAISVDPTATDNNNSFGPNLLLNVAGGPLYQWGAVATNSGASLPLNAAAPDLVEMPVFVDPTRPFGNGFALVRALSRNGIPFGATQDFAGRSYAAGEAPTFGAYRSP